MSWELELALWLGGVTLLTGVTLLVVWLRLRELRRDVDDVVAATLAGAGALAHASEQINGMVVLTKRALERSELDAVMRARALDEHNFGAP